MSEELDRIDGSGGRSDRGSERTTDGCCCRFQVGAGGRVVAASESFRSLTGYARDEVVGRQVTQFIHPEDAPRCERAMEELRQRGGLADCDVKVRLRTDRDGSMSCSLRLVGLAGTGEWSCVGTVRPTGAGRSRERPRHCKHERVVESLHESVVIVNQDHTVEYVNDRVSDATEYDCAEMIGDRFEPVLEDISTADGDVDAVVAAVERVLTGAVDEARAEVEMETEPLGHHVTEYRIVTFRGDDGRRMAMAIGRNVTDRTARKEELRRERDLTELLLRTAPAGISVRSPDGTVVRANERAEDIFGVSADQLSGRSCSELDCAFRDGNGDEIPASALPHNRVAETGEPVFGFNCQFDRPDGDRRWLTINAAPVWGSDGELERVVVVSHDVTEQRERERQLEREQAVVDAILEAVPDLVYAFDEDGQLVRYSDSIASATGYDESQLDELRLLDFLPPSERERIARVVEDVLERKGVYREESHLLTSDGELIPYEYSAAAITDDDGNVLGLAGIGRDISTRKARERELRESKAKYESLIDAAPDAIFVADAETGEIVETNAAATDLLDRPRADIVGRNQLDLHPPDEADVYRSLFERHVQTDYAAVGEAPDDSDIEVYTANGQRVPVEINSRVVEIGDERLIQGVFRDVSDRQVRERKLREQNDRLERLNRINGVIRDVDQVLVQASSRREIEEAVCERLTADDAYQFAWIGRERRTDGTIEPTAAAGTSETSPDDVVPTGDGTPFDDGPIGDAYRTREIQVRQSAQDDGGEGTSPADGTVGFESTAAIPIRYEDRLYGVLLVCASEPDSFGEMEQAVLAELGETIGHAISGLQAKRALVTERVSEVTLEVSDDESFPIVLSDRTDGHLTFEGAVFQPDETLLYYMSVHGTDPERIREVASGIPDLDHVRIVSEHEGTTVIEMRLPSPTVYRTMTDHGAALQSGEFVDGTATITVELPSNSDTREILGALRSRFDSVDLVSHRETERSVQTRSQFRDAIREQFTDRQHEALEIAYYAGFFDWPRESTGEEIATSMDVSPPTFHKHLRLAEQKLVGSVLDDVGDTK